MWIENIQIRTSTTNPHSCPLLCQNSLIQCLLFFRLHNQCKVLCPKFQGSRGNCVLTILRPGYNSANGKAGSTVFFVGNSTHESPNVFPINNNKKTVSTCRIRNIKYDLHYCDVLQCLVRREYNVRRPSTTVPHTVMDLFVCPAPVTFADTLMFSRCGSRRI